MVSRLDRMCRRPRCKPPCFEISILFYFVPRVSLALAVGRIPARSFGLDQVCVKPETAILILTPLTSAGPFVEICGARSMELEGKRLGTTQGGETDGDIDLKLCCSARADQTFGCTRLPRVRDTDGDNP